MQILETTLRDGSYAINFQFTVSDTALISAALEKVGFDLIEVGHGVGLHASESGYGVAAETDEAYLKAAAGALRKAKFGAFCIPGIARLEDIDMAADYGMGFIRVGTNVTEVERSEPYIERAKARGMYVTANFMKSYAMKPAQFAAKAKLSQEFGSDALYIVDSAGGMLPSDVENYFRAVQEVCDIPLALHAHSNLGLAVANTLRAVELGAALVDTSLQGMGRSAGNAATEHVLVALKLGGTDLGIDPLSVMDIGEKYIKPLIRRRGLNSLDITAGLAQFHSSYMGVIRQYASKYQVDPRRLIIEVCAIDKVNAPPELVERVAQQIRAESDEVFTARFAFDEYFGDEQRSKGI
ncbi:MAG: 4-hydroxy-2-oxovalerate aldolase [Chloroflexi bacterium]|nr:4-hydroxy-2-oxovalerate aldolase [Chloroflexota bacterium]